ncbi:MAG: DsbA family oxidoreductase [Burkholderiaceae bacterium]
MNPTEFDAPGHASAGGALHIDVVSDVVCPWCYIGKRQLDRAIGVWQDTHPDAPPVQVRWFPFQLNPDMDPAGVDRHDYLARKFGHADVDRLYDNVRAAAAAIDLDLNLGAIVRQPNTLKAHALLALAARQGADRQGALAEALFDAYFHRAVDLTDDENLIAVAGEAGLDEAAARATLADEAALAATAQADAQAREAGVGGVPFFIVDQRIGVSGAQGVDRLLKAMGKAWEQRT